MRGLLMAIGVIALVVYVLSLLLAKIPVINKLSIFSTIVSKGYLILPISIGLIAYGFMGNILISVIVIIIIAILQRLVGI